MRSRLIGIVARLEHQLGGKLRCKVCGGEGRIVVVAERNGEQFVESRADLRPCRECGRKVLLVCTGIERPMYEGGSSRIRPTLVPLEDRL
jgi:hypothetical protein